MENSEELNTANLMLEDTLSALKIEADKGDYQALELRLTDNDGNVLIKGVMKVADMMALEKLHDTNKGDAMKMFYFALEDDLKGKSNA